MTLPHRTLGRTAATALLAAAPLALTLAPAHAAPAPSAAPSYSCKIDSYSTVEKVSSLKVYKSPSTSSASVGSLKKGATFHYCSSSGRDSGGHYWLYGYGTSGSTKITGWLFGEDLDHP